MKELLTEVHEIWHNVQLIMIVFPASVQVNQSHFQFLKRLGFNMDDRTLKSAKPQQLISGFCGERKIHCLDMLDSVRARKAEEFFRDNADHFNEAGNQLVDSLLVELSGKTPLLVPGLRRFLSVTEQ